MAVHKHADNDALALPDCVHDFIAGLKSDGGNFSEQEEIDAALEIQKRIDKEKDQHIKQFMEDTLAYYCKDRSMLLSYILDARWHDWIREQRVLKKKMQPIELYIELERIMAKEADSTGYTKQYSSPPYKLRIPENYEGFREFRQVDPNVSPAKFARSYYKFGIHTLRVGSAIKGILEHLENRYGISFKELERAHRARQSQD